MIGKNRVKIILPTARLDSLIRAMAIRIRLRRKMMMSSTMPRITAEMIPTADKGQCHILKGQYHSKAYRSNAYLRDDMIYINLQF